MAHHLLWPVGQAVKTPPFHGGNTGSNPVRVILNLIWSRGVAVNMPACHAGDRRFDPGRDRHLHKVIWLKRLGSSVGRAED